MVQKITDYFKLKLPDQFVGWTREALEDYVIFHLNQNTLKVAVDEHDNVAGVVVGWRTKDKELKPWTWQKSDNSGMFWYWDQMAGDNPIAVMACCAAMFFQFPESAVLPAFGVRNGKLRDIQIGIKLYKKGQELYGSNSTSTGT